MAKFSRYKVNCSEISDLMGREQGNNPPTEKDLTEFLKIIQKDMVDISVNQKNLLLEVVKKTVDYDNYSLSASVKKSIYSHYAYSQYKVNKVSLSSEKPLQLDKGEIAEPDAIKLISSLDSKEYIKNTRLFNNKYFKGIPDIVLYDGDEIIGVKDVKVAIDFPSFLERIDGDCLKDDAWEMRGYLDILGLKQGEICYCLVNMPEQFKKKRLTESRDRYILQGYTPEHIRRKLRQIEKSMVYDYIPEELRVRRFIVERKGFFTKQAHGRVVTLRKRLEQLHEKFTNPVTLSQTNGNQE
jgi:hypothetical protein